MAVFQETAPWPPIQFYIRPAFYGLKVTPAYLSADLRFNYMKFLCFFSKQKSSTDQCLFFSSFILK